ncbi:MAG: TatD family hydrolase [Saprospiraceae bacterium]|nr:TatD family hydrolase [Bacteroidia bacterium]NNL91759.1 TatD family hydrolase [Saprospiraceae bacterium]
MYIDSHAHLYLEQFDEDIDVVINTAIKSEVKRIFLPNIDSTTIDRLHNLEASYPDNCFAMMGLHPCSVKENFETELSIVKHNLSQRKYYGIGETGIDLYWDKTFREEQIYSFEQQIAWAKEFDLPVIIHSRDSLDLTIEIIAKHQDGKLKGIFHCFNGTVDQCKKVVDLNFMMGLGGVITFKKANLEEMVRFMPISNMVLETDAPYLAPTPYRGKRNESSYIPIVAEKVAQFKNMELYEVASSTTRNARDLFGI